MLNFGTGPSRGSAPRTSCHRGTLIGRNSVATRRRLRGLDDDGCAVLGEFLTSSYTPGAIAYADSVQLRVVLIDGPLLAQLMIKHGVGVQVKRTIQLVEIDEDFFE